LRHVVRHVVRHALRHALRHTLRHALRRVVKRSPLKAVATMKNAASAIPGPYGGRRRNEPQRLTSDVTGGGTGLLASIALALVTKLLPPPRPPRYPPKLTE